MIDDWRLMIAEVPEEAAFPLRQSTIINRQSAIIRLSASLIFFAAMAAHAQEPLHTLRGHERWVLSIAISPNNQWLVSGGDDQTLRLWNLKTGGESRTLRRYDSAVTAVAFHADGKRVAIGTYDGKLEICDAHSGKLLREFTGHGDSVTVVRFDPTGKYLASGSADDTLVIWDTSDGSSLLTFQQGNEYDVTTAACSLPAAKRPSASGS